MALANYSDLQTVVADYLDRGDLTGVIPDFITLAESSIKHDKNTRFLSGEVRATATLTSGSQYLALPTGFSRIKRMHFIGDPQKIIQVVSMSVLNNYYTSVVGKPTYAAIVDDQFEFNQISDSDYTVEIIYDKFTALSDSNTTNEIFPEYSDIYLYGSLIQAAIYLRDRELRAEMNEEYMNAIRVAKDGDKSSRFAGNLRAKTLSGG